MLEINLLGRPDIRLNMEPLSYDNFSSVKVLALLVYLVVEHGEHTRDSLAALLWPEFDEKRAKANLRNTLYHLRKLLPGYIITTRYTAAFNTDAPYTLDLDRMASTAATLYRGDLLEGIHIPDAAPFEDWLRQQREALRLRILNHLMEGAAQHRAAAQWGALTPVARSILAIEPWNEAAHRWLLEGLTAQGHVHRALNHYQHMEETLQRDLGIDPSPETQALYERLQADHSQRHDNLPMQLVTLVGREREVARVDDLLTNPECRLVSVVSAGGTGKTQLALASARAIAPKFAAGVAYVPLEGILPSGGADDARDLLAVQIGEALGLHFPEQKAPEDHLADYLTGRDILLVIDNFEQFVNSAPLLVQLLERTTRLKMLVTSRERLNVGPEWLLQLRGLPYPDGVGEAQALEGYQAVQMFVQVGQRHRPGFSLQADPASIGLICHHLQGHPLSLELAASWLRVMSPAAILAELTRSLDMLTRSGNPAEDRHTSIRRTLDSSWTLLTGEQQRVFQQLSVFHGSFERTALEAVTGGDLASIRALVDKSMLRHDGGDRYSLHSILRQFGAEKLAAAYEQVDRTLEKYAAYYAQHLAKNHDDLQDRRSTAIIAQLDMDNDDLRITAEWLIDHQTLDALEPYLDSYYIYLQRKGWFRQIDAIMGRAITLEGVPDLVATRWMRYRSTALKSLGMLREARLLSHEALARLGWHLPTRRLSLMLVGVLRLAQRQVGMRPPVRDEATAQEVIRQLNHLGSIDIFSDVWEAIYCTLTGMTLSQTSRAIPASVHLSASWALALSSLGRHKEAETHAQHTLDLITEMDEPVEHLTYLALAVHYLGVADWQQAKDILERGREITQYWDDAQAWLDFLTVLGWWHYFVPNEAETCRAVFEEVNEISREVYNVNYEAISLNGMAMALLKLAHPRPALDMLEQSRPMFADIHANRLSRLLTAGLRATAYLRFGELDHAEGAAAAGLALARQQPIAFSCMGYGGYTGVAETYLTLWEANPQRADYRRAARQAVRHLRGFAWQYPVGRPIYLTFAAWFDWLAGRQQRAIARWRQATETASAMPLTYEAARAHYEWGRCSPETGDITPEDQNSNREYAPR